jgi:hypothetical protein
MYEEEFAKQAQLKDRVLMFWIATQQLINDYPVFRL